MSSKSVPDQDENVCSLEVNSSSEQSSSASNKSFRHDSPEQVDAESVRSFVNSSRSESEYENVKNVKLVNDLRVWVNKHGCAWQCANDLLEILMENGHELPKGCRTLLHTRKNIVTKSLGGGEYIYYGVKSCLEKILSEHLYLHEDIKLLINIDGLSIFKSSSMRLWPILIQFHKFQPVPVALYGGNLKPNMNKFLR